jgi:bifunctional DNA-binding transcriptional regulator/antitoxin component of YhaV-PrlF toxin-antitoxin module
VTIPKRVRVELDLRAGDEVVFRVERTTAVISGSWGMRANAIRMVATVWPAWREPLYAAGSGAR